MKTNKQINSHWFYGVPVVVILLGVVFAGWLCRFSDLTRYPNMISDAYHEDQHHLTVPGSRVVKLTRKGAYGIYIENSPAPALGNNQELPPGIDCSLISKSTGHKIEAVPDYVSTNRYWSKDQSRSGVLIMSITVDRPGDYTFSCGYSDGKVEPEILVALGPNYFWEFLRVAWKICLPLLGGFSTLCGSVLLALVIILVVSMARWFSQGQNKRCLQRTKFDRFYNK